MDLNTILNGILSDIGAARDELSGVAATSALSSQLTQGIVSLQSKVADMLNNQALLSQWAQAAGALVQLIQQSQAQLSAATVSKLQRASGAILKLGGGGSNTGLIVVGLAAILGMGWWAYSSMKSKESGGSDSEEGMSGDSDDIDDGMLYSNSDVIGDDGEEFDVEDEREFDVEVDDEEGVDEPDLWEPKTRSALRWGKKKQKVKKEERVES